MTEIEAKTERALDAYESELQEIAARWHHDLDRVAAIVARLDREQLRKAKRILKPFLSADHVERLALWGRGKVPEYLATPAKSVPARQLRRLSRTARIAIESPETPVEVYRPSGTVIKALGELNPVEFDQVVDTGYGIRTPQKQRKHCIAALPAPTTPPKPDCDVLTFHSIIPDREHGTATVYGRDENGERCRIGVTIPLSTLRKLIG